ncbi:MAG: TrkH family potassium uptake protein [Eubacteriales bacterium]
MNSITRRLRKIQPVQIIALGFIGMILLGGILLSLPIATVNRHSIGLLNALFTSTSSICVTGLTVVDTGVVFSLFGQIVILILIQAGGLGFMTMATFIFLLLGKRISLRERIVIRESLNEDGLSGMVIMIQRILIVTFIAEFIGAALLCTRFIPTYGAVKGIYYSIFHSISAFCNSGFDLFGYSKSFTPFANDLIVNLTVMSLVIIGGIGFVVILDISNKIRLGRSTKLSLHSKIVLIVTTFLIVFGAICFYFLESDNLKTIGSPELTSSGKVFASFFQSITPRTAGFNTIDQNSMGLAAKMLTMLLMFIGASPAGTGGGVKTSTVAVILLLVLSIAKGQKDVNVMHKRIDTNVVLRAIVIVILSIVLVLSVTLILSMTEQHIGVFSFENVLFEVLSAFGTVGLSCGITPHLSMLGKVLIMLTMYAGRIGMLTLIMAVSNRLNRGDSRTRYPEDKIMVG